MVRETRSVLSGAVMGIITALPLFAYGAFTQEGGKRMDLDSEGRVIVSDPAAPETRHQGLSGTFDGARAETPAPLPVPTASAFSDSGYLYSPGLAEIKTPSSSLSSNAKEKKVPKPNFWKTIGDFLTGALMGPPGKAMLAGGILGLVIGTIIGAGTLVSIATGAGAALGILVFFWALSQAVK